MKQFYGIPAAPGMARAVAVTPVRQENKTQAGSLEEARKRCMAETQVLYEDALEELGEDGAGIFKAYQALLEDDELYGPVEDRLDLGMPLEQAIEAGFEQTAGLFDSMKNEYMRQRADDIRALAQMLMQAVQGARTVYRLPAGEVPVIVAAEELTLADAMRLDRKRLAGLVSRTGGTTSHVVILAKTLGIPAVTGVNEVSEIKSGDDLILDGNRGIVTIDPDRDIICQWEEFGKREAETRSGMATLPKGPVQTADGETVNVSVNIGRPEDLDDVQLESVSGVGLYRTEFLFTESVTEPSLEAQRVIYKKVFDKLAGKDLIVRTLDIGGDKQIPYLDFPKEENPSLGFRGIRFCLRNRDLLEAQLTALLLAAEGRPFSIMFPMVDIVEEFREAKKIFLSAKETVLREDQPVSDEICLGVMVETPAAAICIDLFAAEVDFVSIGTNDLTQYIMAADRGNPNVSGLLSPFQPGVLRLVSHVIRTCREQGVKVSVCGEAAADPEFLKLLIGAGLRHVSVSPALADKTRIRITEIDAGYGLGCDRTFSKRKSNR